MGVEEGKLELGQLVGEVGVIVGMDEEGELLDGIDVGCGNGRGVGF